MAYDQEMTAAHEAARRAREVILRAYSTMDPVANPRSDVTTATDRAAQEAILQYLHQCYPGDALCAEEETPTLAQGPSAAPRVWIVDPIDGTRGFVIKNGEFSVMIALVDGDRIALGLVLEPARDRVTYAVSGEGCWQQTGERSPLRCRVTSTSDMSSATLVQSHTRKGHEPSGPVRALRPAQVVETYSAGVKLALVARGELDLYVNTYAEFHDWDIAAGHILVEEAGGRVTGLRGEEIRYRSLGAWQRQGLLATNGVLHQAALTGLAALP